VKPSLTPVLLAAQLGFFLTLFWRSRGTGRLRSEGAAVALYLLWVTAYSAAAITFGARGLYIADGLLPWLPGLWLPLVPVAACVIPVLISERVRDGLRQMVDDAPWPWLATFQGMRVTAIGTAYKTMVGEFPLYFELLVGLPDLAFGASAFWIAHRARRGDLSAKAFRNWNLIGLLVIVPAVPILLQLGLPGPVQIFSGLPDARAVLSFPMAIAPMVVVPVFILTNLLVAWRLSERAAPAAPVPGVGS
jgi:hypothetical protein